MLSGDCYQHPKLPPGPARLASLLFSASLSVGRTMLQWSVQRNCLYTPAPAPGLGFGEHSGPSALDSTAAPRELLFFRPCIIIRAGTKGANREKELLFCICHKHERWAVAYVRTLGLGTRLCLLRKHSALAATQFAHGSLRSHFTCELSTLQSQCR